MLKFVNSFKKNSPNSLASNEQQGRKASLDRLKSGSKNQNNCQNRPEKKIEIKLLVLSIILVLIAIGVLITLFVCIVNFANENKQIGSNKKPTHLSLNHSVKCDPYFNCKDGFLSIQIDNKCFCRSIKTNYFQYGILDCHKMRTSVFKCECRMGYQWSTSDNMCIDVNECQIKNICSDDMSDGCINKIGSYECGCKPGFRWSSLFHRCVDINECLVKENELCKAENSECENTFGGYKCKCKAGYLKIDKGSHFECKDENECKSTKYICANSTCHNLEGTYECCSVFNSEYECINCGFQYFKPLLNLSSQRAKPRIIGGIESNPYSWPWIVSIGINYRYNLISSNDTIITNWLNISHICGGTLISKYTVLTAAHCLYNLEAKIHQHNTISNYLKEEYMIDLAKIITVYAGIHDQNLDKKNRNFTFQVRKIHIHNSFDNKMFINDIALLILDKSAHKSSRVNWACLGNIANFVFPSINTTLYAVGFGSISENKILISNILRQVDLKLLNFSDCGLVTKTTISNHKSQFCAGYLNGLKDTCTGDSGSPILYKYNSRWFVVGIVSYGLGCAQLHKPGINTNVSFYLDWINNRIKV